MGVKVVIENPKTRTALRKLDCLEDNKLNTSAIAALFAAELEAAHVAADIDAVEVAGITVGQLVQDVVGVIDEQLVEACRPLLGVGADGRVQQKLSNGNVLLSARTRVAVTVAGETRNTSIGTRFLSSDPDVIDLYCFQPRQRRVEALATSTVRLGQLIEARQPGMAGQVAAFNKQVSSTWRKAITAAASVTSTDDEA